MKTILIVDDNIDVLVTLGELLNRSGYHVIPKTSGKSALSIIKEGISVDLVLFDYRVAIDGPDVLITLRHLIPSIPFIMLRSDNTANAHLN
jgi:CheY-like chemotaxis protein